jgi:hypothetical protein
MLAPVRRWMLMFAVMGRSGNSIVLMRLVRHKVNAVTVTTPAAVSLFKMVGNAAGWPTARVHPD